MAPWLLLPGTANPVAPALIAGVALPALLRLGPRVWPAIWSAGFLFVLNTAIPPWAAGLIATGQTLALALGAAALRRAGFHSKLDRRRDLWLYALLGVVGAPALAAAGSAAWLVAANVMPWGAAIEAALRWLRDDAMGALVLGIPLLSATRPEWAAAFRGARAAGTAALVIAAGAGLAAALFLTTAEPSIGTPLLLLPHLALAWLAARRGISIASATVLLLAIAAAEATRHGIGPFHVDTTQGRPDTLAAYVASLFAAPLLVSALVGELTATEQRWRLALDTSDTGVGEWDLRAGRVEFSPRWLGMLGYTTQQFGHTIQSFWSRVHPDDAVAVQHAFEPLRYPAAGTCRTECRMLGRDGAYRWLELHALVTERAAGGEPVRIITTVRDIDARRAARQRQQLSERLFQHLHEGLVITDDKLRVIDANLTYSEITGWSRTELLGAVPSLFQPAPGGPRAAQQAAMLACLSASGTWRGEIVDQYRSGEPCTLQATVSVVRDAGGDIRHHVIAISDVTLARQQHEQLERQAHYDELTRLPNRVRLASMLDAAIAECRRRGSLLTVCYLDLDHFKPLNDRHGHDAGDRLLVELAGRLRRAVRTPAGGEDGAARIGGDEFVVLLRSATLEESRHAVERLLREVGEPYALGRGAGAISLTASVGATVYPLDDADAETLLRHADHAMFGAKQAGRNGYLFFDAEHDRRAEARFVALGRVQEALDAGEFLLHFQPKVDLRRGKVLGMEALLRWRHPEHGLVTPAQFLPLVENTALSVDVGQWVFEQGVDVLAGWLRQGLDLTLSLNVSARHLQEPLFADRLASLLARHREPVGQRLVIEVLETAALADIDHTGRLMESCRALGVRFALDDFGTGYSTFTYLKRLPIDMLKVDRSFITNMLHDHEDLAIVEGVIGLSQTFGCSVVAEGVESIEQAERLVAIGCEMGQGNGIAPAMAGDKVVAWVNAWRGMPGVPLVSAAWAA